MVDCGPQFLANQRSDQRSYDSPFQREDPDNVGEILKPAGLCFVMLAIGIPFSTEAHAHGGLALAEDMCRLTIGPYNMHFTGYQPDNTRNKEFCEDIPATGRTVVVLDYMDDALRPLPTEVRVIRDTGSEQDIQAITVLHLPPKVYPNGTVNFEYNFAQPGKYVGLVTVGGPKEHISRFPFSVGGRENVGTPLLLN
jgi:hypothetical protein